MRKRTLIQIKHVFFVCATFSWMMWAAWGAKLKKCPVPSQVFGVCAPVQRANWCTAKQVNTSVPGRTMVHHAMEPLLGKGYLGKTCRIPLIVLVHPLNVWNSIGNKHCNDFFHIKTQKNIPGSPKKMEEVGRQSFYKWIYIWSPFSCDI